MKHHDRQNDDGDDGEDEKNGRDNEMYFPRRLVCGKPGCRAFFLFHRRYYEKHERQREVNIAQRGNKDKRKPQY